MMGPITKSPVIYYTIATPTSLQIRLQSEWLARSFCRVQDLTNSDFLDLVSITRVTATP